MRVEKLPVLVSERSSTGHLSQPVLVATLTTTGHDAKQYWLLPEPYIASLPHTKYALIYSGIASPPHRYDERSDIRGEKYPAPAKQPQKEGGFRGEARRKTWLYQK